MDGINHQNIGDLLLLSKKNTAYFQEHVIDRVIFPLTSEYGTLGWAVV